MAYSSDVTRTLTVQITKFVTLNRHQLAGHVASLDFWIAEVRHCLGVIDGYDRRFEQMKTGPDLPSHGGWTGDVEMKFLTLG
jgi:hypothetical protein